MIADDKQRIPFHFKQSNVPIFQEFPQNFSTEVVKKAIDFFMFLLALLRAVTVSPKSVCQSVKKDLTLGESAI